MLVQKEREHLNAIIKVLSDKAQRIEQLNKVAMESPVIYDKNIQKETVGEALSQARELKDIIEEAIKILEKDQSEDLEVFVGSK